MNGDLAQVMALVTHGTAWLGCGDADADPPSLEATSSTFQFVRSVSLDRPGGGLRRHVSFGSVAPWLRDLRARDTERLLLVNADASGPLPEHIAAAFAGGGSWVLLSTGRVGPELWPSTWSVGAPSAPDRRIWDVRYCATAVPSITMPALSIESAQESLLEALRAIHAFAQEHELDSWANYFAKALALESVADSEQPYNLDLFPGTGYPQAARRLAAIAGQAWVFGGMGSWNDLGFDGDAENERYQRLTSDLYATVVAAASAAVNTDIDA